MHQYVCPHCGRGFAERADSQRHLAAAHPLHRLTATDIKRVLSEIDYPLSWQRLARSVDPPKPSRPEQQK